jgi:hypothetical protein
MQLTEAELAFDEFVKSRRKQGRVTYGQGLDHRDARWDWRQMALEEMVDGCQYLIAEVKRLQDRIRELENGK